MPTLATTQAPIGTLLSVGTPTSIISNQALGEMLNQAYQKLRMTRDVLLVPPDGTRPDANAPFLLDHAVTYFRNENKIIIPALGTHQAMNTDDIRKFFGDGARTELFAAHNADTATFHAGTIDADTVSRLTGGVYRAVFPVHINNLIDGKRLVVAFSHIIPHEVMGMAGYTKHLLVGLGGSETIDRSHEVAALFGIDDTLGQVDTPSRRLLNYAQQEFLADKNIVYVMLVRSPAGPQESGHADEHGMITRGVFVGNGDDLFRKAAALSSQVNISVVEPLREAVVFLPSENYHSFWVAMKGCYRMRLAMTEGGTLHVVCPGVKKFGENPAQEDIIRRYGYQGWSALKALYDTTPELRKRSGIWAHLTHGSPPETSPGKPKFNLIVYPRIGKGGIDEGALTKAHLKFGDHEELMRRFSLSEATPVGFHGGVYFGGNPAKGLWVSHEAARKILV